MPASEAASTTRAAASPEPVLLYLLRHGQADEAGDNADRHLTAEGAARLRAAVPLWRRLNVRADLILSSPLPRARETAELAAEGLGASQAPVPEPLLSPGAEWADLAKAMAPHRDAGRVMLVGHEPDLSNAATQLTGAASVRLRKGGMLCLEFPGSPEPGKGELVWLLDPDLYASDTP
jgi:phosphohistidine phosphatase